MEPFLCSYSGTCFLSLAIEFWHKTSVLLSPGKNLIIQNIKSCRLAINSLWKSGKPASRGDRVALCTAVQTAQILNLRICWLGMMGTALAVSTTSRWRFTESTGMLQPGVYLAGSGGVWPVVKTVISQRNSACNGSSHQWLAKVDASKACSVKFINAGIL